MQRDELHRPLGLGIEPAGGIHASPRRRSLAVVSGALAILGLVGGVWIWTGESHETVVSATIVRAASETPSADRKLAKAPDGNVSSMVSVAGEQIETENGVRVIRAGGPVSGGGVMIRVPQEGGAALSPSPDSRLVETGRFGPLPKIGADGSRPSDVYRRPLATATGLPSDAPRIALLVSGMGLNADLTQSAISRLPADVSLAFAPLGAELEGQVQSARKAGHEVLLQVPMEALVADDARGLPHELTTEARAAQNIENLRWHMSRFAGYFGIMNFMGSKLTSDAAALGPILQEVAGRGLAYVDDGTSPESVAPQIAADLQIPIDRADVVIDARANPETVAAAFNRLKAIARSRGAALGVAAGFPMTIDSLANFAESLRSEGIALVPASALLAAPPSRSAASSK